MLSVQSGAVQACVRAFHIPDVNRHIEYHIEFFKSGFNAVVKKWLAGGCQETPEEMDEIIRSEYQGRS